MSTLVDQARRTHCPKCGTNHPNPSCKYMVPTDFDEARHQLNNDLCDFSDRWELDGDYMRCRKCRRPQIASTEGHPYIHGERCKASTGVDQYPWRMLRDLIARMYPPSSVQPEKEERRPNCFRKKPVVIEAWQVHPNDGKTRPLPPEWLLTPMIAATRKGDQVVGDVCVRDDGNGLDIHTLEGVMHAATGDWIIRGVKGEIYPCRDDIFRATYERVGDAT